MTEDTPDEPVKRVEVEHEDGTVRVLTGPEAQAWVEWVAKSISFMQNHGGTVPDVKWEEVDDT